MTNRRTPGPLGQPKVLFVSHSGVLAGAELSLSELAGALSAQCEVLVVVPEEGPLSRRLDSFGVRWSVSPLPRWAGFTRRPARDRARVLVRLAAATGAMVRVLRKEAPDWVVTNTATVPVGAFAARVTRTRHAWFVHENTIAGDLHFDLGPRTVHATIRHLSDVVLVPSELLKQDLAAVFPASTCHVVRPVIATTSRTRREKSTGPLEIVCLGHRMANKGQLDAVRAMAILRAEEIDAHLTLAGRGDPDYDAALRDVIEREALEGSVALLDFVDDPHALVAQADLALSCSRYESFGRTVVEAMKMGVPVVATRAGSLPALVSGEPVGLFYRPGDPVDLARCLRAIVDDPEGAMARADHGRRFAEETFNATTAVADFVAALAGSG